MIILNIYRDGGSIEARTIEDGFFLDLAYDSETRGRVFMGDINKRDSAMPITLEERNQLLVQLRSLQHCLDTLKDHLLLTEFT